MTSPTSSRLAPLGQALGKPLAWHAEALRLHGEGLDKVAISVHVGRSETQVRRFLAQLGPDRGVLPRAPKMMAARTEKFQPRKPKRIIAADYMEAARKFAAGKIPRAAFLKLVNTP